MENNEKAILMSAKIKKGTPEKLATVKEKGKTVFLEISSGAKFAMIQFANKYDPTVIYEEMTKKNVDRFFYVAQNEYNSDIAGVGIKIHEFGEVDPAFVKYVKDRILKDNVKEDFKEYIELIQVI